MNNIPQKSSLSIPILVYCLLAGILLFAQSFRHPEETGKDSQVVSVFLDKMNVLLVGIDNPVTIITYNDNAPIKIEFEKGSVSGTGVKGKYILHPTEAGPD